MHGLNGSEASDTAHLFPVSDNYDSMIRLKHYGKCETAVVVLHCYVIIKKEPTRRKDKCSVNL